MARDLNNVMILGNLGADPEKRFTTGGKAVVNLRIATNERWRDKEGNDQELVEWHTVVVFDQAAEFAAEYLKKGSRVLVQGKLQTRKWEDKEGKERYSTEIVAFPHGLSSQDKREDGDSGDRGGQRGGRAQTAERSSSRADRGRSSNKRQPAQEESFNDEIPFGDSTDTDLDKAFGSRRGK